MNLIQKQISLQPRKRGCHLITAEIINQLPELKSFSLGILHLLLQHTSASLTLNENADPDVRMDMDAWLDKSVPENAPYFRHTLEGADDMPAHIKVSLFGNSLTLPLTDGRINLGTWQGIYLCEHRNRGGSRSVVATALGALQP